MFSKENLQDLLDRPGPCVSIYMPLMRKWNDVEQDLIRLKTQLYRAERELVESGLSAPETRALLSPAYRLKGDNMFWRGAHEGLAMFLAPGFFRRYRLPLRFHESVFIQPHFFLKPLLPVLGNNAPFYVLAVSLENLRLIHATRDSAMEVELGRTPRSVGESLADRDPDEQLQAHGATSPRRAAFAGKSATVFHSQSTGLDGRERKKRYLQHFDEVDKGVRQTIGDVRTPLVLAGVDYVQALYRQANRYASLLAEGVTGSPDRKPAVQLAREGWEIVRMELRRAEKNAALRFQEAPPGRVSSDIAEILPAAHRGRIEFLFVPDGAEMLGRFDRSTQTVELHDGRNPDSEDLVNLAALYGYMTKGRIFVVPSDEMPLSCPLAAYFRY